jgi:hypothetical protein
MAGAQDKLQPKAESGNPSPGEEDGGNLEMDSRLRGNDEVS